MSEYLGISNKTGFGKYNDYFFIPGLYSTLPIIRGGGLGNRKINMVTNNVEDNHGPSYICSVTVLSQIGTGGDLVLFSRSRKTIIRTKRKVPSPQKRDLKGTRDDSVSGSNKWKSGVMFRRSNHNPRV